MRIKTESTQRLKAFECDIWAPFHCLDKDDRTNRRRTIRRGQFVAT